MTPTAPDISSSPLVLYAAIAVVLFAAAGTITSKGLGPISRGWFEFAKRRREATVRREAVDLTEMRRQITNLSGLRESDSERISELENLVVAYVQWSFLVRQIAGQQGLELPEPPKLHT